MFFLNKKKETQVSKITKTQIRKKRVKVTFLDTRDLSCSTTSDPQTKLNFHFPEASTGAVLQNS